MYNYDEIWESLERIRFRSNSGMPSSASGFAGGRTRFPRTLTRAGTRSRAGARGTCTTKVTMDTSSYTKLYDLDQETNGLYICDREPVFGSDRSREINEQVAAFEREA